MKILHLTASPFYGGPERQMLGLGLHLGYGYESIYASFLERGLAEPFLQKARENGFATIEMQKNFPNCLGVIQELSQILREIKPDVFLVHGYKPDILGWFAARKTRTPIIAVSRGWTSHTLKVRMNDTFDKISLLGMDQVVCVSQAQAAKVLRAGVPKTRVQVIHNAIDVSRFANPNRRYRQQLQNLFPTKKSFIIGSAGRLSPEKGYHDLINAMPLILGNYPGTGLVIFGEGPLRNELTQQIRNLDLDERVILAGFKDDLDQWVPNLDAYVLSSHSEGLPNVVLEAFAAHVPVVATAAGGTTELVQNEYSGLVVAPGDVDHLALQIREIIANGALRKSLAQRGFETVTSRFSFASQAEKYKELFARAIPRPRKQKVGV